MRTFSRKHAVFALWMSKSGTMTGHEVSVVIATYNGADTLKYVLEGLRGQTFDDFEVVAVVKPSGDGTEELLRKNGNELDIKVVIQETGHVVDAERMGLEHSEGRIIVFLDDDAVPKQNCIEEHVKTYADSKIGGVAGDVIVSAIVDGAVEELEEVVVPPSQSARTRLSARLWNRPLKGLENYRCCVTKCGSIWHGFWMENNPVGNYAYWRKKRMVPSFLGLGANMSVLACAGKDVAFKKTEDWKKGFGWEQALAWQVWKKGYNMVLNPEAKVQHIFTGEHLTGDLYVQGLKNAALFKPQETENDEKPNLDNVREMHLFFFRLYSRGSGLSLISKFCSVMVDTLFALKSLRKHREFENLRVLYASNVLGLRWLLSGSGDP
jgi:glycosyltransferase involved in cell wall biosynthesis